MKTRRPLAILAATAIAGLGLTALATPASANTTVTISGSGYDDASVSRGSVSGTSVTFAETIGVYFEIVSESLSDGDGLCSKDRTPKCIVNGGSKEKPMTATFEISQDADGAEVTLLNSSGNPVDVSFTVTYSDGSSPAPVAPAAPAVVDVTLDQITSEVLRTWASTATLGSWKQLPESSEIIGVDENAGKTFLGAATTPTFPVDIAQRQVDKGWGPYETFNDNGQITSVFIPAGKSMNISGPTRLYAIWSD